ncbi:hypothetical protein M7I_7825 [Glarea lozoyensis 74030]|uniref:Uncharacterized protein n=1 Tax=Glarea lozoyensis (strain ATCC 74030 / MF5533) TaxID=1104152 RepID=H0EYC6_GLAL7|nr:hypothetical protein M7I_7825 [Glarea lozoyensis 74030]
MPVIPATWASLDLHQEPPMYGPVGLKRSDDGLNRTANATTEAAHELVFAGDFGVHLNLG